MRCFDGQFQHRCWTSRVIVSRRLRCQELVMSKALQVVCTCRVQKVTNTVWALGGGTGRCHPVDCQSRLPIEHAATPIWINNSSGCVGARCCDGHYQHQLCFRPYQGREARGEQEQRLLASWKILQYLSSFFSVVLLDGCVVRNW